MRAGTDDGCESSFTKSLITLLRILWLYQAFTLPVPDVYRRSGSPFQYGNRDPSSDYRLME
jgi:hypothetical protein